MGAVRSAKELARHLLYSVGWRRKEPHLAKQSLSDRFSKIYEDGVWSSGWEGAPLSGTGSSLEATANLRTALPDMISRLGVKTLVDVGCGDFTWMRQIELPCDYVGVDIVDWLVERNQEEFGSPAHRFVVANVVTGPLPEGDLILCREVLFHLSLEDGVSALRNMLASGCSHLLLTTDRATSFNAQIDSGDFRLINLSKKPYGLPEPIEIITDDAISKGRFIGLWRAEDVRRSLS